MMHSEAAPAVLDSDDPRIASHPELIEWARMYANIPKENTPYRRGRQPVISQPEAAKWARITKGMTRAELTALLGPPMREDGREHIAGQDVPDYACYTVDYGELRYQTTELGPDRPFMVLLNRKDEVWNWHSPFPGAVSLDGQPTRPRGLNPPNDFRPPGHSGVLDLRWTPSAGRYPLHYEVEAEFPQFADLEDGTTVRFWIASSPTFRVEEPYLPLWPAAASTIRWRVRARNELGVSEWTEWHFIRNGL